MESRCRYVGSSSSIEPNDRILIENSLAGKADQKNLAKRDFGQFTLMEKIHSTTFVKIHFAKSKF